MTLTTQDIIKILPFEDGFKKELLENFDKLSDDQKFNIERIVWGGYDALYELKLQKNLQIALDEAALGREKINHELYNRVRDLTEKEMSQVTAEEIKAIDLDVTREKLAAMITSDK